MTEGILDHTLLLITFPNCPRTTDSFKYCDMWSKEPRFQTIVGTALKHKPSGNKMYQLTQVLKELKKPLKQLNTCKFKDIYNQLAINKAHLESTQSQLHQDPLNLQLQNMEK